MRRKMGEIISALLVFIMGVCIIFYKASFTNVIALLLSAIYIIYGVLLLLQYFNTVPKSYLNFASGILSVIIGVVLLFKMSNVYNMISVVLGFFVIIMGLSGITRASEYGGYYRNLNFGLSLTNIVIGALCVIGKLFVSGIFMEYLGILLIIYSVIYMINTVISV